MAATRMAALATAHGRPNSNSYCCLKVPAIRHPARGSLTDSPGASKPGVVVPELRNAAAAARHAERDRARVPRATAQNALIAGRGTRRVSVLALPVKRG